MAFNNESLVARKQIAVNKSQWLPKLELGYRRNTETGTPFNGVVVDSPSAFRESQQGENSQSASAEHRLAERQRHPASGIRTGTALSGSQNAAHLYGGIRKTFQAQQDLALLKQALTGGQISMIEYFVEVSVIYQSHQNYLQLENQYQKAMARIYKSKL